MHTVDSYEPVWGSSSPKLVLFVPYTYMGCILQVPAQMVMTFFAQDPWEIDYNNHFPYSHHSFEISTWDPGLKI